MKKYEIRNIDCANCAAKIENKLSKMPEVKFVSLNFASSTLVIDAPDMEVVRKTINEIEPEVELVDRGESDKLKTNKLSVINELFENRNEVIRIIVTIILLASGIFFEEELSRTPFGLAMYLVFVPAYLISGWGVLTGATKSIFKGKVLNEHFLMTIATLGAFAIGALSEAVTVMLFYVLGELFQSIAVNRSRRSVKTLLEIRPDYANLKIDGQIRKVNPTDVHPGQIIIVKPGEKIPLDGVVIEGISYVDTSALTGEPVPKTVRESDMVLAGMMNQSGKLTIEVKREFGESSISRILDLVENASSKKAETEKFITTFARYYTPIVVVAALLIAFIPPFIIPGATFSDWIYRALVILVISCPCALVISIPLGYFGGIGGASRRGVLVKGSNYLDALTKVRTVIFDKTGTLTKGEFKVADIISANGYSKEELLKYAAYAESNSNHPIAASIIETYNKQIPQDEIKNVKELPGYGLRAKVNGDDILVGSDKLLQSEYVSFEAYNSGGTTVYVSINNIFAGCILISDTLKEDAVQTISELKKLNIRTVMLTGDNDHSAGMFAGKLGISEYYAGLLPEDKVTHIEKILNKPDSGRVAFVGDGINDAPVLARADVGIAMGALGSDAAVETADIVLMTDSPYKVVTALKIARDTRRIVLQNIGFAFGVKLIFILLGLFGVATMWEAVFGDMGVAIIAIINAMRVLKA